jgi:hypothetical protein
VVGVLFLGWIADARADSDGKDRSSPLEIDHAALLKQTGIQAAEFDGEWSVLTSRIGDLAPDEYAGAEIKNGYYIIGFRGLAPEQANGVLASFSGVSKTRVRTHLGYSRVELQLTARAIMATIQANAPGTIMQIVPMPIDGQLVVSVDPSSIPPALGGERASDADNSDTRVQGIERLVDSVGISGAVSVRLVSEAIEPPKPAVSVIGGGSLSTCTAGFTSRTQGNVLGVFSAGHCSSSQPYEGNNILTSLGSVYGALGDGRVFQVASGNTVTKTFRVSSSTVRTQTASADPAVGSSMCKYGMTGGMAVLRLTPSE